MHSRRRFAALQSFSSVPEQHFPKIDVTCYFSTFPPIEGALKRATTAFQLREAVAFWARVWSASLFPVQTESHRRKPCLPSAAQRRSRSPVKSQGRGDTCLVFLLPSTLNMAGTCYRSLAEPNKRTRTHINMIQPPTRRPAAPAYSNRQISKRPWKGEKQEKSRTCFRGG